MSAIGDNRCPEDWRDDEYGRDFIEAIFRLADAPYVMEACHLGYIQFFGNSYSNSDTAALVRKTIYDATGREVA